MKKNLLTIFLSLTLSTSTAFAEDDPFTIVEEARQQAPYYDDPFDNSNQPDYFKDQKEHKDDKVKHLNNKLAPEHMQLDTTGQQRPASSQDVLNDMMKTR